MSHPEHIGKVYKLPKVKNVSSKSISIEVIEVVRQYHDMFAWEDMSDLNPSIAQHKLNVDPEAKSVK